MATLTRSCRRCLLALGLVAVVLTTLLTGPASAATRDADAARITIEATPTTATFIYLKIAGIPGESTRS